MVTILDKTFDTFIDAEQIAAKVAELGAQISADYADLNPLIVPVLNGAFVFAADLIRNITCPAEVSFIKVASYEMMESRGEIEEILGIAEDIAGRHILLVEDIVDTGLTMQEVVKSFKYQMPASVQVVSLLVKPDSIKGHVPLRYVGFNIGPDFVVGFGMDYNGQGRNLPAIYKLTETSTNASEVAQSA